MAADIVQFPRREREQEQEQGYAAGTAVCSGCKHEWAAVAPIGAVEMECPACGTHKGLWKYPFTPSGDVQWACNCGSTLFFLDHKSPVCRECGTRALSWGPLA